MLTVKIGINVKEKDGSQAVRTEVIRIFMDDNIESSAVSLGRVSCKLGEVESAPYNFY